MPRSIRLVSLALLLAGCVLGAPIPTDSADVILPTPVASASLVTVASPTVRPTPTLAPTPGPTPDVRALDLAAESCPGGVVLQWTASAHPDFHHYLALRSPEFEIAPNWPPIAPAVDWGDTYATDRFVTSAVDASILPSATLWYYRVMAYDEAGRVLGATPVHGARIGHPMGLGTVTVDPVSGGGAVRIGWGPFRGRDECFTEYRVLYGTGGVASTLLGTVSDPAQTELLTDALEPGAAYTISVEAVRTTLLGSFVAGRGEPVSITIP
ncbi:MAG TPA: fibronectin type III domain-containing protein [Candidatus Limnocylindria bacterium]|nr:fibronectin type III domain-containing protein [Candidatus Limnocylindria bacterium]